MPATDALRRVADWLVCPVCDGELTVDEAVGCVAGHRFDIARQGYVNLLGRSAPANADSPAMLQARETFLAAGHFAPVADAVADAVKARAPEAEVRLLETGAGTGYYAARMLEALPGALGLASDVSPAAARRAARAHPRLASVVADTWAGLPVRDGAVDVVLCVFAPRNPAEFARVLRPGGTVVVTLPQPDHMLELRRAHGLLEVPAGKAEEVGQAMAAAGLRPGDSTAVRTVLELDADAATAWVSMGPNAHHKDVHAVGLSVTSHVLIQTFHRP